MVKRTMMAAEEAHIPETIGQIAPEAVGVVTQAMAMTSAENKGHRM